MLGVSADAAAVARRLTGPDSTFILRMQEVGCGSWRRVALRRRGAMVVSDRLLHRLASAGLSPAPHRWPVTGTCHGQPAARDEALPPQAATRPGGTDTLARAPGSRGRGEADARGRA